MNRIHGLMALIATAVFTTGAALAGAKFTGSGDVLILLRADQSGYASGFLGMIYNGAGMKQWIGCQRSENDNVMCHANDESNTSVSCSVRSAYLAQSVSSLSPDARVIFYWNASGTCTRIQVVHSSEYQDKQG
jgi:hypothetical protein